MKATAKKTIKPTLEEWAAVGRELQRVAPERFRLRLRQVRRAIERLKREELKRKP